MMSAWVCMNQKICPAMIVPPNPASARAPRKSKLGHIHARATVIVPRARVANITNGAATRVHTPNPAKAQPNAVAALSSAEITLTCACLRKSIARASTA